MRGQKISWELTPPGSRHLPRGAQEEHDIVGAHGILVRQWPHSCRT